MIAAINGKSLFRSGQIIFSTQRQHVVSRKIVGELGGCSIPITSSASSLLFSTKSKSKTKSSDKNKKSIQEQGFDSSNNRKINDKNHRQIQSTDELNSTNRPKGTKRPKIIPPLESNIQPTLPNIQPSHPILSQSDINDHRSNTTTLNDKRVISEQKDTNATVADRERDAIAGLFASFADNYDNNNNNNNNYQHADTGSLFSIPDPPPSSSFNKTQEEVIYEEYIEIMKPIIESEKWQRKHISRRLSDDRIRIVSSWLLNPQPVFNDNKKKNVTIFQNALTEHDYDDNDNDDTTNNSSSPNQNNNNGAISHKNETAKLFRKELRNQQERLKQYLNRTEGTVTNSAPAEDASTAELLFDPVLAEAALLRAVGMCARHAKGMPVPLLWMKIKELGCTDQQLLQNLLYVSATFTSTSMTYSGSAKKRMSQYSRLTGSVSILDVLEDNNKTHDDDDDTDSSYIDVTDEIAIYHDLLHKPTEQTVSIRVRLLVTQGNAVAAENLLLSGLSDGGSSNSVNDTVGLRLRAFTPVLRLHLEQGNVLAALSLYKRMRQMPFVIIDVDSYVHLLCGLAERGVFDRNSSLPTTIQQFGFQCTDGPGLLNEIAYEMSQDIIEIPEQLTIRLQEAFHNTNAKNQKQEERMKLNTPVRTLSMGRVAPQERVANRVQIDTTTGECPMTGIKLRLISLSNDQKEQLKTSIIQLARSEEEKHKKTIQASFKNKSKRFPPIPPKLMADEHLIKFYDWLDTRTGIPYTAIIDGANIGYYMQNFYGGRFSFHQLQFVYESLQGMGENPLMILPSRYTKDSFTNAVDHGKQYLTPNEKEIRNQLQKSKNLFIVPPRCLDDYYWILASVSSQTKAMEYNKIKSLHVPTTETNGRWPGARPVLITNDRMRDHKVEMLEPMIFRRWCSNYIVNYNFAAFVDGECTDPEIAFSPADFFSREIQGNTDETGAMVWHFPINGKDDEWFCIRIPTTDTF